MRDNLGVGSATGKINAPINQKHRLEKLAERESTSAMQVLDIIGVPRTYVGRIPPIVPPIALDEDSGLPSEGCALAVLGQHIGRVLNRADRVQKDLNVNGLLNLAGRVGERGHSPA